MRRLTLAILLLAASSLLAQERHQIFKIYFHSRIPASILLTQSALAENRTYTDDELEIAMARLRRLPFVYSVSYGIDGSALVISVNDEYRTFFGLDSSLDFSDIRGESAGGGHVDTLFGGRYYLPWAGIIQGSFGLLSSSDLRSSSWGGEYAQYGMFGTRTFLVGHVERSTGAGITSPTLTIGYPLTLRQTLSIRANTVHDYDNQPQGVGGHVKTTSHRRNLKAIWLWDTTNDPMFASRGSQFTVEGGRSRYNSSFESVSGKFSINTTTIDNTTDVRGAAQTFYPFGRGAFSGLLDATQSSGTRDAQLNASPFVRSPTRERHGVLLAGYVYNFFDRNALAGDNRHRGEFAVGLEHDRNTIGARAESLTLKTVQLGYAFRNRKARFHFVVSYLTD